MTDAHRETLERVFCDVVEKQACLFCSPMDPAELECPDEVLRATIEFQGPNRGRLTLMTPRSVAREVAAGVLGVDADDDAADAAAADALGELMNVASGQLVTELFSTVEVYEQSPPSVTAEESTAGWSQLAGEAGTLAFDLECEPVLLRLDMLDSPVPAS